MEAADLGRRRIQHRDEITTTGDPALASSSTNALPKGRSLADSPLSPELNGLSAASEVLTLFGCGLGARMAVYGISGRMRV